MERIVPARKTCRASAIRSGCRHDGGLKPELDCIKAFSETDFTDDLKKFDVPTFHPRDDDQIVPINDSALLTAALVKGSKLKYIRGPARFMLDAQRPGERGSAGVPQELDHPPTRSSCQPGCKRGGQL